MGKKGSVKRICEIKCCVAKQRRNMCRACQLKRDDRQLRCCCKEIENFTKDVANYTSQIESLQSELGECKQRIDSIQSELNKRKQKSSIPRWVMKTIEDYLLIILFFAFLFSISFCKKSPLHVIVDYYFGSTM